MLLDITAHAPALGLAAVCFVLASLLDSWERSAARRRAQQAERSARPGTAQQDAAAIAEQAVRETWQGPR
ncbi:hypothetical protein JHN55_03790 [Streptomyces sp. MBT56]|uniref:hypothetical protein n=1 Tax=unclassified Streptomyces TaxID=2593676 RepID=UPI00190D1001|nr:MULTISPECIES: hypothetical protein [unclassified Streptomyces]MBK3555681.1 hypothetical protein [Streptomyces sp. MBT56]MBK3617293.1 hypothetical protein [Streptomyces sp. MBT98]